MFPLFVAYWMWRQRCSNISFAVLQSRASNTYVFPKDMQRKTPILKQQCKIIIFLMQMREDEGKKWSEKSVFLNLIVAPLGKVHSNCSNMCHLNT